MTKSYLATALLALAGVQLAVIAAALGWFGSRPLEARRRLKLFHRVEGYAALLLMLAISYDCVFVIQPHLSPVRAGAHTLLGVAVLVLIFTKIAFARAVRSRYDLLPKFGVTLFSAIVVSWLSSAAWYFIVELTGRLGSY